MGLKRNKKERAFTDYIYIPVSKYFTNELTNKNSLLKKYSLIIPDISVSPSLINLLMTLQTENVSKKNKITHFISSVITSVKLTYHL
jgi:hypothetical protein